MFTDNGGFAGTTQPIDPSLVPPPTTKFQMPGLGGDGDWEWKRRIDEWRGCDASGLRVEQQYISERAANDVLVSLSNGQIGPIDFDGDGHITMTRKAEVDTANSYEIDSVHGLKDGKFIGKGFWPNFPFHKPTGKGSVVEYVLPFDAISGNIPENANYNKPTTMDFGVIKYPNGNSKNRDCWRHATEDEIITNCVTLPIKFQSHTFRVTVSVELTDKNYKNVSGVHRYQRVYSRLTGLPVAPSLVHGPITGEFIMHSNRAIDGVDPENSWLGADFGSE